MPTLTIEYQDEAERLALEQAIAVCTQMRQAAPAAPAGAARAACARVALRDGRALLRRAWAGALQARAARDEQKGGRRAPAAAGAAAPAGTRGGTRARS